MKVSFVGVGAIGLPMALQIQRAGHEVTGVDVSPASVANAKSNGLEAVEDFSDARAPDVVVVMVPVVLHLFLLGGRFSRCSGR